MSLILKLHKRKEIFERILHDCREVESYQIPKSALLAAEILAEQGLRKEALEYLDIGEATNQYGYQKTFRRQIQSLRRKLEN